MSDKRNDLIIDPKDFPVYLKARMLGESVADFAAKLGISTKMLYMLLSGERDPSKRILAQVDLEIVFRAVLPKGKKG